NLAACDALVSTTARSASGSTSHALREAGAVARQKRLHGLHQRTGRSVVHLHQARYERLARLARKNVLVAVNRYDAALFLRSSKTLRRKDGVERHVPGLVTDLCGYGALNIATGNDGAT